MKKVLSILGIIIIFFIIYFLQINFFNWFNIAGIKPNLFILLILCIGLFTGKRLAIPLGIIFGIYLDILTSKNIGLSAIMFCLVGYLGAFFSKNFSKDSKLTILLMVAGSTVLYETFIYIYISINNLIPLQMLGFLKILAIEVIFNVLLTIILYPIIRNAGYFLENTFKNNKVLTRYF